MTKRIGIIKRPKKRKKYVMVLKGGSGSGNFGHAGRPGKVGGSSTEGKPPGMSQEAYEGMLAWEAAQRRSRGPVDPLKWEDSQINDPKVLSKLEMPDKLYHVTERANISSYKKKGIIAKSGVTEKFDRGAYLTPDPIEVIESGGGIGDIDLKDPVVLEISTKKLNLRLDPEYWDGSDPKTYVDDINNGDTFWAMYSRTDIPPSAIINIVDPEDF